MASVVSISRRMAKGWLAVASLFALLCVSACEDDVTAHSTQVSLPTVTSQVLVGSDTYTHSQQFTGTVRAGNTTDIGFELAGKLNQLTVDSGDQVQQGQLLAKLDTRLLEAEALELSANLAQNQADLDLASNTLKRSLSLKQQNYVSEQALDEAKGQLRSLQAAQQRLNAALHANQLKQDKSALRAPFSGRISKRLQNRGEVVSLGSPIFTLIGNNSAQAYIGIPVDEAQQLAHSQKVTVRVGEQVYDAQIAGISAEIDPLTRTVEVRISLPQGATVLNGEIAYLDYNQDVNQSGFWVPISALTDGIRGLWNIYVLTPNSQGNAVIARRDVEILYTDKERAYIQGAISNNEHYVSQGLHKLVAGQEVKTTTQIATRSK